MRWENFYISKMTKFLMKPRLDMEMHTLKMFAKILWTNSNVVLNHNSQVDFVIYVTKDKLHVIISTTSSLFPFQSTTLETIR